MEEDGMLIYSPRLLTMVPTPHNSSLISISSVSRNFKTALKIYFISPSSRKQFSRSCKLHMLKIPIVKLLYFDPPLPIARVLALGLLYFIHFFWHPWWAFKHVEHQQQWWIPGRLVTDIWMRKESLGYSLHRLTYSIIHNKQLTQDTIRQYQGLTLLQDGYPKDGWH